ncbi:TetR/AcrR family transcriptional regulator [Streptomyces longispororuber]|uniref:TetR/AcrR family transcriptional regulator n=1 Tax=Streptomyces longispororuber TaxID=68230 RepID=UPI00210C8780|nr:TetR/AcrR family transcriptional regulator [Streptomyces longispororuber]MCQ4213584.1 TetR/AcrR family transcriptional regulator [Streptomyces longispororuber]
MNGVTSVRADANRRRILDVALAELLRDPDASMDQIARAAGVVRRTVYGHFPSREALVGALVDDAAQAVAEAHRAGREGIDDPAEAVARSIRAIWPIADRYRLLVHLAQRSVTMEGIRARLAPVREVCTELIQQAQDNGEFTSPLPAEALAYVQEQVLFGLMEAVNDGALAPENAARAAVVAVLSVAGHPTKDAERLADSA